MGDSSDVVGFVRDLMDQSRIQGAIPGVRFVREPAAAAGADVAVVDLGAYGDVVAAIRAATTARIVAFGPHVDEAAFAAARNAGADTVLPRSQFFRDPAAALAQADRPSSPPRQ